jgi:hypothetical protein
LTSPSSSGLSTTAQYPTSHPSPQMPFNIFGRRSRQNNDLEMPDGFVPPMHTLAYRAQLAQAGVYPPPTPETPKLAGPASAVTKKDKRWKLSNIFRRKQPSKVNILMLQSFETIFPSYDMNVN